MWVTLLYAVGRGGAGALQALVGRFGRAMLLVALEAQPTLAASSRTIVHTVNAEMIEQSATGLACGGFPQTCGPEVGAVYPHPVQDHREFAR